jgi:monoamine oxidase
LGLIVSLYQPCNIVVTAQGTTVGNVLCDAKEVLIVGAGFAGLAAAKELKDNGFTDFLIIESTTRVGGRVSTVQPENFDSLWVEEGANWIAHFEGNPILTLAQKYNKSFVFQNFNDYRMFQYNDVGKV